MFTAQRQADNTFAVKFSAREQDDPPFGPPNYNDLNKNTTRTHTFNANTGWSNLPDNDDSSLPDRDTDQVKDVVIELVGSKSNTCQVKLYYDVTLQ